MLRIDYLKEVALEPEKLSLQELAREYAASILECTKRKNVFSWWDGVSEEPFALKLPVF